MDIQLELPDLPDVRKLSDRDLRSQLGRTRVERGSGTMPYGVTNSSGGRYQARLRLAGISLHLGMYTDLGTAVHVVHVVRRRWADALEAEMRRRGLPVDAGEIPLPDVTAITDRQLSAWYRGTKTARAQPCRQRGRWVARIRMGERYQYFGRFRLLESADAVLAAQHQRWIACLRQEMARRLNVRRAENAQDDSEV